MTFWAPSFLFFFSRKEGLTFYEKCLLWKGFYEMSNLSFFLKNIWTFLLFPEVIDWFYHSKIKIKNLGPVVQSVVSLTSSLRVISLTVLADSIYNFLIFFAEKCELLLHCKSYSHFFSKKFQHICISLDVNFNESLTNDIVSFEQLGPGCLWKQVWQIDSTR